MSPTLSDPRPTDDLGCTEAWPFEDGAVEVILRVGSYQDGTFQAIVKSGDATAPWGVGVDTNPVLALDQAIRRYYEGNPPRPTGGDDEYEKEVEDLLG